MTDGAAATGRVDGPTDPVAGLSTTEAAARRAAGLGNEFRPATSRSWWGIVRENAYLGINGPLVAISILLLAIGRPIDAAFTAGPVLGNILIGVVQEARAKRQLDRIALLNRPRATVVRDGETHAVDPAELVVGDLVLARRGDEVVVDGRLVGDGSVELDEALLTGESDAVQRRRGEEVHAGTAVVSGVARYVVERVGRETTANLLLDEARGIREERTPLQQEIAGTIRAIAGLVVAAAAVVALTAIPAGGFRSEATLEAAAVLVTLVPQGLAIMVTVTYAAGALRVSRLGALVQRRNAVESMSRVDTLCIDKTGTLTTQRISFAGLEPTPGGVLDAPALAEVARALAASTGAPNRTTEAIAAALDAAGAARPTADEIPFSSERRWSALRFADDGRSTWVLGVPTVLLAAGSAPAPDRAPVLARAGELAATGRRVLLLSRAPADAALRDGDERPTLPAGLEPVGLVSFVEELRPGARETLAAFGAAGVEVRVISGDDPATVAAIGRQVGLGDPDAEAVAGTDLVELSDAELGEVIRRGRVFGRVEPGLKARLVAALRGSGRYVAMIGDGVNDLLPLRRAHLGIAMESGSPATRGAADLVLLGDSFAVLPKAVVEGQRILAAMQATLIILLARTFYVLLIIVGAALLDLPFPLTPRQNSGLAFVTVGIPLIVLALWVPPRRSPRHLVLDSLVLSIPASMAVALVALPVYWSAIARGAALDEARTILTTLTVFCGLGLLPLVHPAHRDPLLSGRARAWPWLLAILMAIVYAGILALPPARELYELEPIPLPTFLGLFGVGLGWTLAVHLLRFTPLIGRLERGAARALGQEAREEA